MSLPKSLTNVELREDALADTCFEVKEERAGWKGYVEWEDYPEKKEEARKRLARYSFPPPPEFQLGPLPDTNPVLEGIRWKLWHRKMGGALTSVPEISWKTVLAVSCFDCWTLHSTLLDLACLGSGLTQFCNLDFAAHLRFSLCCSTPFPNSISQTYL